jgi:ActR/RegA family two-component response regulator
MDKAKERGAMDVLVISNNRSSRIAYTSALTGYGYEVAETPSFNEAASLIAKTILPRNIVIDLKLSAHGADDFIDYVRQVMGRGDIRIIVIGGNAQEAQTVSKVGADMFLFRPVKLDDLIYYVQ